MNRRFVLQALAAGVAAALVPRDEPVLTLDAIKRVRAHIMRDQIRGEWFAILPSKARHKVFVYMQPSRRFPNKWSDGWREHLVPIE